jgi:Signal transduction histidine kinase
VQQILGNLLSNAVKFTPEGGRIEVRALLERSPRDRNGGMLVIDVEDTGVGIADEEQQVIFEKFRQSRLFRSGEDAMTREFSGTGLGLSIVRELCRLLGGDVSLASELGRGSTFTVRLPARLSARQVTDPGGTSDSPPRFGESPAVAANAIPSEATAGGVVA